MADLNLLTGEQSGINPLVAMILAATQGRTAPFDPNAVPNRLTNPMFTLPKWYRQTRQDEGFSTPSQNDMAAFYTTPDTWSYTSNPVVFGAPMNVNYAITPGTRDRSTTTPYTR